MTSSTVARRSFQQLDQFTQQLTGQSVNPLYCISLPISLTLLLSFPSFPREFLLSRCQTNYLSSAEDKVLQCLVGVALIQVVTEKRKLCRDPCTRMQLNRHRTHASTATITTSECNGSSSKSEGEG